MLKILNITDGLTECRNGLQCCLAYLEMATMMTTMTTMTTMTYESMGVDKEEEGGGGGARRR